MKDEQIIIDKKEKAKKITTFIISIFWYLIINLFLYFIDFQENGRIDWAYWVTFGWGIGIVAQLFTLILQPMIEEKVYDIVDKK
jgi:2TM domain